MATSKININPEISPRTTHVIVEFNIMQQKSSELVLFSWMFIKKDRWYCKYPVGAEMQFAEQYVADNHAPQKKWASHKVKILSQAENYIQGIRRLNRYLDGVDSLNSLHTMPEQPNEKNPSVSNTCTNQGSDSSNQQREISDDDTASVTNVSSSSIEELEETLGARSIVETANMNRQEKRRGRNKDGSATLLKASLDELQKNLAKIDRKFGRLQRNITYEMKELFKDLKLSFVAAEGLQSVGDTLPKCIETIGVDLPLNTLEEFFELDQRLKYEGEDEEKKKLSDERRKALKTWMKLMWNSCKSEKDATYKVLPAIMTKPVQLRFSGSGRKIKGQGKENFSATNIFQCMSDILVESYSCNKDTIRGIVGKWLAGAADRDGGKKNRSAV